MFSNLTQEETNQVKNLTLDGSSIPKKYNTLNGKYRYLEVLQRNMFLELLCSKHSEFFSDVNSNTSFLTRTKLTFKEYRTNEKTLEKYAVYTHGKHEFFVVPISIFKNQYTLKMWIQHSKAKNKISFENYDRNSHALSRSLNKVETYINDAIFLFDNESVIEEQVQDFMSKIPLQRDMWSYKNKVSTSIICKVHEIGMEFRFTLNQKDAKVSYFSCWEENRKYNHVRMEEVIPFNEVTEKRKYRFPTSCRGLRFTEIVETLKTHEELTNFKLRKKLDISSNKVLVNSGIF